MNGSREFYHSIHPRVSVLNVEKPACLLRKFTPDGRYLLALSASQTSLLVYEYRGVTAAGQLFTNNDIMFVDEQDQLGSVDARHHLFDVSYFWISG
jgi:de-etiolated-1